jgi:hypothetical protein
MHVLYTDCVVQKNAAESKSEESGDENMEDADVNENDSSSDSESTSDSDSSSESDASETSDASENNGGAPVEQQQPTEVPADVPADEIVMKHRRLSNAGSERSRISAADVPAAAEEEPEKPKKEKKDKKGKKEKKVRVVAPEEVKEEAVESESEDEEPKVLEKKAKKDKKEKRDKKAEKAEKKRKRAAESESKPKANDSEEPAAQAEKWQVDDLEGGSARQAKFLRLLGGKKAGATAPAAHGSKGTSDSTKAEADIQRQFEAGMKMKNEGGSKRRGLGA